MLQLHILTPTGPLYQQAVHQVVVTTTEGQLTILAHHAPYVFQLQPGFIQFQVTENAAPEYIFVLEGVATMQSDGSFIIYATEAYHRDNTSSAYLDEKMAIMQEKLDQAADSSEKIRLHDALAALGRARELATGD